MNLLNRYVYHVFSVIVLYICVSIYICMYKFFHADKINFSSPNALFRNIL